MEDATSGHTCDSWRRVQAVIWLDPSFATTLWSVTARTVRRAFSREELWPGTGNRESLAQAFFSAHSGAAAQVFINGPFKFRHLVMLVCG